MVSHDITKRKEAEDALRLSEEKFSNAFRYSPDNIVISTVAEGRYIDVNEAFLRFTGYSREEVIGHTSLELGIWVDPEERSNVMKALRAQGQVNNREFRFRNKDGGIRTVLWSAEVNQFRGEECCIAVTKDITERKRPCPTSSPPVISPTNRSRRFSSGPVTTPIRVPCSFRQARAVGLRLVTTVRDLRFAWEEMPQQLLDEQQHKVRDSLRAALIHWAHTAGEASDYTDNVQLQCLHPVGHWYEIPDLFRNGVLARLLAERPGLTTLLLHNIDTLGANVDPTLMGLHLESGATLSFEVITRRIDDRGGGLARVDGRVRLVEGLAMPRDLDRLAEREFRVGMARPISSLLKKAHLRRCRPPAALRRTC